MVKRIVFEIPDIIMGDLLIDNSKRKLKPKTKPKKRK